MPVNPESLRNLPQFRGKSAAEIERIRGTDRGTEFPIEAGSATVNQGLTLDTEAILDAAEPAAAAHVLNIVTGRAKVPHHVRAQVSMDVLKGRGRLRMPVVAPGEDSGAALEALAKLVALRVRKSEAADAAPVVEDSAAASAARS